MRGVKMQQSGLGLICPWRALLKQRCLNGDYLRAVWRLRPLERSAVIVLVRPPEACRRFDLV